MPNNIIDQNGMYLSTQFTGTNGTWTLVSSESSGDSAYSKKHISWLKTGIACTIDEFKNIKTGARLITTRGKVYKMAEEGSIF